ncbi:MAG TPA: FCD domain-containing protein [Chthoniobacterales bacterium]|jgi:GntR family transcriptional regulator, transcriptional repressor for pyruvate dehydrogenase complex|nr:FCD domain-containing protein [Chthoniobacterales bacterium]
MMSDKPSPAKGVRRLTDTIAEYLITTARELAPGSKLPSENQLARQFGVSRSAVREAVSGVASRGLLEIRKGAGMFVRAPLIGNLEFGGVDYSNLANTAKLLEIRAGLDAAAARIAAIRRTADEVKFLQEMNAAASRADLAITEAVEADLAFHLAIVRATRNEYFVSIQTFLLEHLRAGIRFTRTLESYSKEMVEEVQREHTEILQAIEDQDSDRAARLAEQHVRNARSRMRSAFASHVVPDIG